MEIDGVIERYDRVDPTTSAKPRHCVTAHGEENEGHVELERLGGALGGAQAVPHDLEGQPVAVLHEFPSEQRNAGGEPEQNHPSSSPVRSEE